MTNSTNGPAFIPTRQHERFAEFCEACRKDRFMGVCTGRPGVGKTRSAQMYSDWHTLDPLLASPRRPDSAPPNLEYHSAALFTPDISITVRRLQAGLAVLRSRFNALMHDSLYWYNPELWLQPLRQDFLELLIIDEAHRLSLQCLEAVRDFSDKHNVGVVLLGMPGFQHRIRSYDHIGNRICFFHIFNTPRTDELRVILESRWQHQRMTIEDNAVDMIEKVTSSNLQKVTNINAELSRVCELNSIQIITADIVEMASRTLLLDPK